MKKYSANNAIKMLGFTVIALMAMVKPAFSQEPEVDHNLLIYSMALSPDQQVKFRFPLDMRSNERITGSVVEEKKNEAGAVNNASSSLTGAVIEIDGKQTKLNGRLFSFLVPAGVASLPFLIKNAAGEIIQKGELPVGIVADIEADLKNPVTLNGANFKPDAVCQPGQPLTIAGKFDGNGSTTNVSIGGQPCEVIAEAGNFTIVQVSPNIPAGVSSVSIQENSTREEHTTNVVTLNLSVNNAILAKGKKTPVNVIVSGLPGLAKGSECRVRIENLSPSIVSIKGTSDNAISHTIPGGLTGDYTYHFNIVGVTKGNYTLAGSLFCASPANAVSEDGPEYKAWQQRLRDALAKRLREEGFTPDEVKEMKKDSTSIGGTIKNLWRLYKMWRAIKNARKDVGDPPDRNK